MSTYVPIQAITLSANTATVSFTSIPQTYTDLVLVIEGALTASGNKRIYFNGVGTDQSSTALLGNGSSAVSARYTGTGTCYLDVANAVTNRYNTIVHIQNYANTTTNKTYLSRHNSAAVSAETVVGLWRSTSAITSFDLNVATGSGGIYGSGTTFTLYGVGIRPLATGGNEIRSDGTYWYHIFTSSGTFTPTQNLNADYLVVAGGGGGGGYAYTGGGGAGGLRCTVGSTGGGGSLESRLSLVSGTGYTVTVGGGGAGAPASQSYGAQGSNSVFSTITSTGGGAGAPYQFVGGNGGSGGGGGGDGVPPIRAGGTGTANQGYAGGAGGLPATSTVTFTGGGGGGAGAVGQDGQTTKGGDGGTGVSTNISGSSTTYAGGGGGGGSNSPNRTAGSGGSGGGGAGASTSGNGVAGTANTGGGGGGGGWSPAGGGGAGGSGIVIVRYLVA